MDDRYIMKKYMETLLIVKNIFLFRQNLTKEFVISQLKKVKEVFIHMNTINFLEKKNLESYYNNNFNSVAEQIMNKTLLEIEANINFNNAPLNDNNNNNINNVANDNINNMANHGGDEDDEIPEYSGKKNVYMFKTDKKDIVDDLIKIHKTGGVIDELFIQELENNQGIRNTYFIYAKYFNRISLKNTKFYSCIHTNPDVSRKYLKNYIKKIGKRYYPN